MEDLTGITGNSYVVVDLQKIKRNVEKIRAHIGENVKFLPVLKGATCGHGLEEIAEFLVSECQFDMLCVGHTIEAERIRNFGVNCDILVLGGTPFNNIPYVVENKITTTLSNADYARALSAEAVKRGTTAKVHIKINSGLGRMGAKPGGELAALLNDINGLPGIDIEGAYTHFSNSAKSIPPSSNRRRLHLTAALHRSKRQALR